MERDLKFLNGIEDLWVSGQTPSSALVNVLQNFGTPSDGFDHRLVALPLVQGFVDELVQLSVGLAKLEVLEGEQLGRTAARRVFATLRWSHAIGDALDTSNVCDLLGVSRQALAKRQTAGSVLGLPANRTTIYPTWQFDLEVRRIRPRVRDVIGAFRDTLPEIDPRLIAGWARNPNPMLDQATPAHLIQNNARIEEVVLAAQAAVRGLAQ